MTDLKDLKNTIENFGINYQIEILRLLHDYNKCLLNENNNGVFVNMMHLDNKVINKIQKYINYVEAQQQQLTKVEKQKMNIENEFFKDNKDNKEMCLT